MCLPHAVRTIIHGTIHLQEVHDACSLCTTHHLRLQLFPKPLKKRLSVEAQKKWDEQHGKIVAEVTSELAEWVKANPDTAKLTAEQKLLKEELDARLAYLKSRKFEDHGPVSC